MDINIGNMDINIGNMDMNIVDMVMIIVHLDIDARNMIKHQENIIDKT
jgi:hypothetical protein